MDLTQAAARVRMLDAIGDDGDPVPPVPEGRVVRVGVRSHGTVGRPRIPVKRPAIVGGLGFGSVARLLGSVTARRSRSRRARCTAAAGGLVRRGDATDDGERAHEQATAAVAWIRRDHLSWTRSRLLLLGRAVARTFPQELQTRARTTTTVPL